MTLNKRRDISFILGFGLIYLSQLLIRQPNPVIALPFAQALDHNFLLYIDNPDNVFLSVILLILAGVAIGYAFANVPAWGFRSEAKPVVQEPLTFPRLIRGNRPLLVVAVISLTVLLWRLHALDSSPLLVVVWLAILILVLVACYRSDRQAKISLALGVTRRDMLIVVAILTVAIAVGTYRLDWIPNSVIPDESAHLQSIREIASGRDTSSFFDFGVYSYPFPATYVQAMIYKYFGESLWSWRFASVVPAVLGILPTYLLALALFDRRIAVLAAVIMAVTPYLLAYERLGYLTSQSIFPVALCVYLLYLGWHRRSIFYVASSGIVGGLGFYTYFAARLGFIIGIGFFVLAVLYLFIAGFIAGRKADATVQAWRHHQLRMLGTLAVVFLMAGFITLLPEVVYGSAKDPQRLGFKTLDTLFPNTLYAKQYLPDENLYRDTDPIVIDHVTFFFRSDLYGLLLVRGFIRSLLAFHLSDGLMNSHYIAAPLPGPLTSIFFFIGLTFALIRRKQPGMLLILLWLTLGVLLLSVINTFPPREDHLAPLIPAMSILSALGIVLSVDYLGRHLKHTRALASPALIAALLVIVIVVNLINYFVEIPQRYPPKTALNVIAFNAFHMQKSQNIVYISANIGGLDGDWVKFISGDISYQQVHPSAFMLGDYALPNDQDTVFYFSDEAAPTILPLLQVRYSREVPITGTLYLNGQGQPVVVSWTYHKPAH